MAETHNFPITDFRGDEA